MAISRRRLRRDDARAAQRSAAGARRGRHLPGWLCRQRGLSRHRLAALNVSVTEAPLRLIEHVITHDRPYTEIVTADYTLADGVVAAGLGHRARRRTPAAGRARATSTAGHMAGHPERLVAVHAPLDHVTRTRTAAAPTPISRALLCYDFLSREIAIDATHQPGRPRGGRERGREEPGLRELPPDARSAGGLLRAFHPIFVPQRSR